MEALLILGFGLLVTVLWLVIGWRAMKAHETLADQAKRANDRLALLDLSDPREALQSKGRRYKEFVGLHPDVNELSSKERHERFRDWEIEQADES